jgi:DNA-binding response OmpR family regulator
MSSKVLLVNEDATMLDLLESCFDAYDCRITRAVDGSTAIEALEREDFDLIITDLQMRMTNGLKVVKKAKELRPQTTVFMVTDSDNIQNALEGFRLGADEYLLKPFSCPLLLQRLKRKGFSPDRRTLSGKSQESQGKKVSDYFTDCKMV